jgi:putative phosphoesterase
VRVVVVADTHIKRGSARTLPAPALAELERADVILHAGDVVVGEVLEDLGAYAPVHAVLGNNDHELVGQLPETRELTLAGVRVAMVHDSGPARGRADRLHRRFPRADVVVFGHSHVPWNEPGVAGQLLFNPGSPTERRRQPHHTIGVLDLADGEVVDHRVEPVSEPA